MLLTGLPSAGKSTLALSVAAALRAWGVSCEILDGDELRARLPPALGFSREDRSHQFSRALFLAELLAGHGIVPLLALVAPFAADRRVARHRFADAGWFEIFLDAPARVCRERDTRGVYAALAARGGDGLIEAELLGVYEPPAEPDLVLDTSAIRVDAATRTILDTIGPALTGRRQPRTSRTTP